MGSADDLQHSKHSVELVWKGKLVSMRIACFGHMEPDIPDSRRSHIVLLRQVHFMGP